MDNAANPILFVEDDPLLSDLVSRKLANEHIATHYCATGEAALEFLKQGIKPVLVLLDLRLPGIDGFEVLKAVRSNETTRDVPVIVFSNFGENADVEKAKELGANKFVVKVSLSLDEVVALIRSSVE